MRTFSVSVPSGVILALLVIGVSGCGKAHPFKTAPVKGTVTFKGEPLHIGSLLFVPEGGGPTAQGNIDRNGNYYMHTYESADGAKIGSHKVMIMAITSAGGSGLPEDSVKGDSAPVSIIPEKFGDQEKSGLVIDVKAGSNVVNFELTPEAGKVVPVK